MTGPPEPPGLPRPTAFPAPLPAGAHGYQLEYALTGPPHACLVQQVTTQVRFLCDGVARLEYHGSYAEFFRLDANGEAPRDVHGFDLRRDGWSVARVQRLLARHALRDAQGAPASCRGEARLEVEKRFLLGLGAVEDAEPGSFGYLAFGPASPTGARLTLSAGPGGTTRRIQAPSATPFGDPQAGRGRFLASRGWLACERLRWSFATRSAHFEDGGGYQPAELTR